MSAVNFDTDWPLILSNSDTRILELDKMQEVKNENNILKIGIICLVGLSIAYKVYLKKKIKSKEFRNNYID